MGTSVKELTSSHISEAVFLAFNCDAYMYVDKTRYQTCLPVVGREFKNLYGEDRKTSRNLDPTTSLLHISSSTIALLLAFVQSPIPI